MECIASNLQASQGTTFTLTVAHESPRQIVWCLRRLREFYPDVPVTLICDGTGRPTLEAIAHQFACRYVAGEKLKALKHGAQWWARFFRESLLQAWDICFKIDSDTHFHRRFANLPNFDFFGTVVTSTKIPHLQGGIQGFSRSIAVRALNSGYLDDPLYSLPEAWTPDRGFSEWCRRYDYLSTDWTILHAMSRLGITPVDWLEVNSSYRDEPANGDFRWAVTHPHKLPVGKRRPRIALLTLYSPEISEYAKLSLVDKARYCDRYEYDLIVCPDVIDVKRPASWSKIKLIERHLHEYDWIFWSDVDSLIVNHHVRLEDFADDDFELIMTADENGINAGHFMLRNCPAAVAFLAEVYRQDQFTRHRWWEQAAMHHLFQAGMAGVRLRTVPQSTFNSYLHTYRPGDFLIHFAGKIDKLYWMQRVTDVLQGSSSPDLTELLQEYVKWFETWKANGWQTGVATPNKLSQRRAAKDCSTEQAISASSDRNPRFPYTSLRAQG